ncbi:MAG: prolyl oligopeptidase family serine peptidase [Bacteroides sp.]|nr:prolyl oligopeptidase family serine peptidase [Roseburia sp.]MCM1345912.1 prolyl oligopeptidase family serine peptidase [Bacteroides sp.]MCM1421371.1 prolyl oligopeptidase family serine peptidase [Bacteroides sp.]
MKRHFIFAGLLGMAAAVHADTVDVVTYRYAGPYAVQSPLMVDSVDVNSRSFDAATLLDTPLSLSLVEQGQQMDSKALPGCDSGYALHLLGFSMKNDAYTTASIHVEGIRKYQVFVDGVRLAGGDAVLEPAVHDVVIKYLSEAGTGDSLSLSVEAEADGVLSVYSDNRKRSYTLGDVMKGKHCGGVSPSPDGKYLLLTYYTLRNGGRYEYTYVVRETATGRVVDERKDILRWMPRTCKYYYRQTDLNGNSRLVAADPRTHEETVLAENFPSGRFSFSPTEEFVIFQMEDEGPKEKKEIYEVIEPEDRQQGWRNRSRLVRYDMKTGLMSRLTYGYHNVSLADISGDGRFLLVMKHESRLTERPTTLSSLYRLDLQTLHADTLVSKDGFMSSAAFSPDGRQVVLCGSPEAFGGIGKNVGEGQIPSMIDNQMYVMDIESGQIRPLTKYFNPSVLSADWNKADNMIYFNAEDKDCINLFCLNPANGKIKRLNVPEEIISGFALADSSPMLAFYGQSASNSDRIYTLNTKNMKTSLVDDLSRVILKDVELGECRSWTYINDKGDSICCRYYMPPNAGLTDKLPMIVNYYGGCSPTSRYFESRYPHHAYAALGYVVLVINPSGATGFGQEFSARHVNTAGEGVAEDIIGATAQFCKEHSFVDAKKIGCIGASYGGFMTQYLQTRTDMFAAAISHAGISDHTSYWGEGYWGYSYSEVSMARSYPWTDKKLYVDQSPLFNADKIHTPLLFLHGSADVNVPVGESIQMYTALKLLGRETALVVVDGQDHHITDYNKRVLWQNTIYAWFAKWLKDDSTWWNAIYKPKSL